MRRTLVNLHVRSLLLIYIKRWILIGNIQVLIIIDILSGIMKEKSKQLLMYIKCLGVTATTVFDLDINWFCELSTVVVFLFEPLHVLYKLNSPKLYFKGFYALPAPTFSPSCD
ncbi:hypothetical protein ACJX0J_012316, partial [Zea mays]